jgi:transglutaminase-like putative cysteine protease
MATTGSLRPGMPEIYRPNTRALDDDDAGTLGRFLARMRPDEGWLSLPLVLILAGTMAWSISDARWILGQDYLTSFLIWIGLLAALWGYVSARLDIRPWLAQTIGCFIAAFVLIEVVGSTLYTGPNGNLADWFNATSSSVVQAYLDLTWRHKVVTLQVGHFCLILGILVWGTAQAASYDVFGYHRAVNGVLLLSVALIANMALTANDQFTALVVFSAAGLVLLLLAHAADERSSWQRHRIWRGREFQAPHLQGGMAFACAAVAGSLILTTVASSAPLGSAFQGLGSQLSDTLGGLSGLLPKGGSSRIQSTADFGSVAQINPVFHEATRDVFSVRLPDGPMSLHWRLISYDEFQGAAWKVSDDKTQDDIIAGLTLDAGTLDQVGASTAGRIQITSDVHIQDTAIKHLIVPNEPDSVNVASQRTSVGSDPNLTVAWYSTSATDYVVSSYVPNDDPSGSGLTEWRLRHAGTDFPTDLLTRYTQGAELVKAQGQALLADIAGFASSSGGSFDTEYDVAKEIQDYLHSDRFTYNTDLTRFATQCSGLSTVDCFALVKNGFCEQYATTMTMLMRMEGYPARYVQGYLPGPIDEHSLVQEVTTQQKHAWVEVWFPNYGWIPFDPTGGGVGQPTELVPGSAVVATPTPSIAFNPQPTPKVKTSHAPGTGSTATSTSGDNGAAVFVPALLFGVLVLALFILWRRRPRQQEGADTVYRSVVRLASRLGYKPRPTQTVYEYTNMLAEVVPRAREPLAVVATATVESAYGRRQLGDERLISLAAAHRLVRQALLRLALRLPRIRRPGRGKGGSRARKGAGRRPRP